MAALHLQRALNHHRFMFNLLIKPLNPFPYEHIKYIIIFYRKVGLNEKEIRSNQGNACFFEYLKDQL